MPSLREAILATIDDFCRDTGMSQDRLARLAVGDHHFVPSLRRGAATLKRLEKLDAFMRAERRRRGLSAKREA